MHPLLNIFCLFCLLTSSVFAAENLTPRSNPEAGITLYKNGLWYEQKNGKILFQPGDRYAKDGVFVKGPIENAKVIDLEGQYVIPPFGEAHNHNVDGPWTMAVAKKYLKEGVFYYKNPNNVGPMTENFRHLWNTPTGLDVIFSHGGLSVDEGHPEALYRSLSESFQLDPEKLDGVAFFNVATPELLEQKWPDILAGNPDFLKLYLLDHTAQDSDGLPADVFKLAVKKAKQAGLRTTVHVETAHDLQLAVESGADETGHLPGYNFKYSVEQKRSALSHALVQQIVESGFVVVTTTQVSRNFYKDDPEKLALIRQQQADNIRQLKNAGARLAIGSDSYMHQAWQEVDSLRQLEVFTDQELLKLWIDTPSVSIFPERAIGVLSPGYEASFLTLDCNPLKKLECVRDIQGYIKQGQSIF